MATIERFEDLKTWQLAREVCKDVWHLIKNTRLGNDYELVRQISRSSGSVMDNIAEGFERNGNREFIQFLSISKGSCGEVRSQLYRTFDRGYITQEQFNVIAAKVEQLNKQLGSFIVYLNKSVFKGSKFSGSVQEPDPYYREPETLNPEPETPNPNLQTS